MILNNLVQLPSAVLEYSSDLALCIIQVIQINFLHECISSVLNEVYRLLYKLRFCTIVIPKFSLPEVEFTLP